jgi:glycerol-3-phosphate dehydrogenase (NAD(P)+)
MSRIAVIGSGAWGTALALSLSHHKSHHVRLWSHSEIVAESIRTSRENSHFLPGFSIPEKILITTSMREAAADAEIVLTVAPSHHVRHVYSELLPLLNSEQILVSATKGIEDQSYLRMSQVIAEVLAKRKLDLPVAVLSGPSFAQEVAAGRPTAVTLALAGNHLLAERLQADFTSPALRIYTSEDVTGVEIGGSLKNVIAIASGIVAGLGLGSNSAAALITRGLAEITRLAVASGGRAETLSGLAGIGDLVLTATGALSRNRAVGLGLGHGQSLPEIVAGLHGKVAEGIRTTRAALGLARLNSVEMPITEQVAAILYDDKPPLRAISDLLARPGRDE